MKKIKRFISDMDVPLLIVSIILFVFGLLNIVNASSQAVVIRYGTNLYYYFYRQLAIIILGVLASLVIIKIPTKKYYKWGPFLYFSVAGLLIYLLLFGNDYLGSRNWIQLFGFKFQPSEFAKPVMIICLALLFEKFCPKLRNSHSYTASDHFKLIGIILFTGVLFPALVLLENDLGTMLILTFIFGLLFLGSPIKINEKIQAIIFGIITIVLALFVYGIKSDGHILTEEQLSRLDYHDPCSQYEDGGYQICNGFIAIHSGGLFGVGIGNSKQVSYLPESHTDSVFAIIAEEYGLIFCTIIFILYAFVLYRIFHLASTVSSLRNKYICFGIGCYIALHIIINLGGLFGSLPLTGVPLPFLSYGGSYTLSLICSLTVVQRICIEKNNERIRIK